MQTRSHLKSKSFAPRSCLPRKQCTRLHLWEPRPVANADSQPPEKQKLRPEVGPPTKQCTRPHFVGGATCGECRLVATSKAKASPRGRASHKNSARAFICGRRDPRRMQTRSHLKSKSFAPRSGLPRKQCTRAHFLWEPRPAANADSQPPQKQKLRPEVGPPTRRPAPREPLLWKAPQSR